MAFRFWRRMKIAPGITLNMSKTGPSVSFGPRGAKLTVTRKGGRATGGIPGTGLFYSKKLKPPSRSASRPQGTSKRSGHTAPREAGPAPSERRLTLSFFQKLLMPKEEENFVYGCREYVLGNKDRALEFLSQSEEIADAAYLAGLLALKKNKVETALEHFSKAEKNSESLGRYFDKYGITPEVYMHVTGEMGTYLGADERGLLLLLVELYQEMGKLDEARKRIQLLLEIAPEDDAVKLSFAEILFALGSKSAKNCKEIIELTKNVKNDSPIHTALLFYKAKALHELRLFSVSKDVLTSLVRRKKDRPKELLCALYYERALVYEELGWKKRARTDMEGVFAMDPGYEDVGKRLGVE